MVKEEIPGMVGITGKGGNKTVVMDTCIHTHIGVYMVEERGEKSKNSKSDDDI